MLTRSEYDFDYYNDGRIEGYTLYSRNVYGENGFEKLVDGYLQKASDLNINLTGKKILIVGCAYGFSVEELVNRGFDAYGIDFSSYAVSQVPQSISSRVFNVDVSSSTEFNQFMLDIGMGENDKFELAIDENMWVCMNDVDATTAHSILNQYSNFIFHLYSENPALSQWYNYKTVEQLSSLIGESEKTTLINRLEIIIE